MGDVDFLEAFKLRDLQNVLIILRLADRYRLSRAELQRGIRDFLTKSKRGTVLPKERIVRGISCMQCRNQMWLYPVNTTPGNQVGGDYKSQWWCSACDTSIFNTISVEEEAARLSTQGVLQVEKRKINPKRRNKGCY